MPERPTHFTSVEAAGGRGDYAKWCNFCSFDGANPVATEVYGRVEFRDFNHKLHGEACGVKWEKPVAKLVKDRDVLLTFDDFPAEHWEHIRTSNRIESTFATVRHRTKRAKGCLSRKTGLAMAFRLMISAQAK